MKDQGSDYIIYQSSLVRACEMLLPNSGRELGSMRFTVATSAAEPVIWVFIKIRNTIVMPEYG